MASSTDSTPKESSPIPSPVMIDDAELSPHDRIGHWASMLLALSLAFPLIVTAILMARVARWFKRPTS